MNNLKYKFAKESKNNFLEFLKVAIDNKYSGSCDLDAYADYEKHFGLDENTKKDLENYVNQKIPSVDITESDDDNENIVKELPKIGTQDPVEEQIEEANEIKIDDLIYAIKENLENNKNISGTIIDHFSEYPEDKLENIFEQLSSELNLESVQNLGNSLKTISVSDRSIISYYLRFLLFNKLKLEYSDGLQNILNDYFSKYPAETTSELVQVLLLNTTGNENIFQQYIDKLNNNYKALIFKEFIFGCNKLHSTYLPVLEILINNQTEFDSLNKLTEIMSNAANDFSNDKTFGKFLMNVIKNLGKNMIHLEKPLKRIIGTHSSIWKPKIQKLFDTHMEDSLLMSQSFRQN